MLTDLRSVKSEETRWEENFLKEVFPHTPFQELSKNIDKQIFLKVLGIPKPFF